MARAPPPAPNPRACPTCCSSLAQPQSLYGEEDAKMSEEEVTAFSASLEPTLRASEQELRK